MYNPYSNPYMQNYISQPAPQMEILKANGEEGVNAFPMAPNSSAIFLDTKEPLIWVAVTDSAGYKTVNGFSITPYIPEQPVTPADLKTEIGSIIERLDKIEERMSQHAQSNNGSSWQSKSDASRIQPNVRDGKGFSKSNGGN